MSIEMPRRAVVTGAASATLLAACNPGKLSAAHIVAPSTPPRVFRDDAVLLERAYTALHPGLYRYNTPAEMGRRFAWLRQYLSAPRSLAEAYLALARLTAAVRCGHSYPNFYNQSEAVRSALFMGRNRVPFHFRWLGERMIVTRDLTPDAQLAKGSEIVRIEGMPAAAILRALMPLARADGHNDAKRRRILEVGGLDRWEAFDIYLPMALPQITARGTIRIDTRDAAGHTRTHHIALVSDAERKAAMPPLGSQPKDAVLWRTDRRPGGITILSMPTWGLYNGTWDWRAWLEAELDTIASDGTARLIIDLRGNEGGLDCGNPILARLIDRKLVTIGNGRRVRYRRLPDDISAHVDTWDNSFRDWGATAVGPRPDGFYDLTRSSDDAEGRMIVEPAGKRFRGKVNVLIDAVNSSATFQFAQVVKDNRLGTLIGETTGGNRRGINGGAFLFLRLPASGLEVDIPLIGYFPPAAQPDAGIEPDIAVIETPEDIASGHDRVLARAMAQRFG